MGTLTVRPDNTYEIKIDDSIISTGDLLNSFSPPVNPPKEIADPDDRKPAEWDEREKIPDPDATKPEDWDESEPATIVDKNAVKPDGWLEDEETYVADPSATKPSDWDDEMDGEWEAPRIDNPKCADAPGCGKWNPPTIANPKYKGTWRAPMIDNPNFKGEWKPRIIQNPNYFEDNQPFKMTPIAALGLELWSMTSDITFDNFIISDNETVVEEFTALTWEVKTAQESSASSGGLWHTIKSAADERPWLWAVYVVVILLPIVLLSICLCPSSGPVKPEDIAAHKKKFDDHAHAPDFTSEVEQEEVDEATEEDAEKEEEEKDIGAGGDSKANPEDVQKPKPASGEGDQTDEEDEQEGEELKAQDEGSPEKSSSPRRRKARKD